ARLCSPPGPMGGGHADGQPVVILLGWAGCQDKYLAKYSTIYSQKGCTVIRYTAPWRMIFFSETFGIRSLQTPARRLLELLFDYTVENRPVLFHVFSNGGVMLYRYIIEVLHTHKLFKNLKVAGTIFDSAPGRRNLKGVLFVSSCLLLFSAFHVVSLSLMSNVLLPCTDFTIQLFHVFVVFFSSLPFLLSCTEQTEAALQDLTFLSVHPSSCYTPYLEIRLRNQV
uniref:Transmembrane protein 53 n=1 Tax=Buteo japonicus TaxID=224669 RepID=A0A8C0BT40_9AVES